MTTNAKRCDVRGCNEVPAVDFRRHIRVTGIPGEVRCLCERHARGIKVRPEHRIAIRHSFHRAATVHGDDIACDCTAKTERR